MGCQQYPEAASAMLDNEETAEDVAAVYAHLELCAPCRVAVNRAAVTRLARIRPVDPSSDLFGPHDPAPVRRNGTGDNSRPDATGTRYRTPDNDGRIETGCGYAAS